MASQSPAAEWRELGLPERLQISRRPAWLTRPLCCRYVLAEFKSLHLPVRDGDAVHQQIPWRWALGLFKPDEYEILGAWPDQVPLSAIANELHDRGMELLQAISPEAVVDFASRYPRAGTWPQASNLDGAVPPSSALGFGRRRIAALQSATATAERLQHSIMGAIKRQAPFADEAAAVALLMRKLENADCQLQGLPKMRSNTTRRPSRALGGNLLAASRAS
jgi:hypothetical protein